MLYDHLPLEKKIVMSQLSAQPQGFEASSFQHRAARQEIDQLNNLAWRLRIGQKERAYELCVQAVALAHEGEFVQEPYNLGIAASLATMAIINADCGKPDDAMFQCAEALSLLEGGPSIPILSDVWIAMSWIYIYVGSYPPALDYGIKALNLARELKDRHREAWALDAVASSYSASGDTDSSIDMHHRAVAIFNEMGDMEGQARTLNNMACALLEAGQLDLALEASKKSLELAHKMEMKAETAIFAGTICDILIAKGDYQQAEEYVCSELSENSAINQLVSLYRHVGLGRLYLAENRLEEAETNLDTALGMAQASRMVDYQAECHRMLSQVAEGYADLAAALDHYKQFHQLKEITTGEETARRLAILRVTHQSESAMRDAETYRLHNIELQREIEERKRVESLLHKMAMRDPLTNLYNRRQFYALAKQEIERAKLSELPLSLLMLDLDDFKRVNDHYGHLVGDMVLVTVAGAIQADLREKDIIARYGGEEFVVLLPETEAQQAYEVSERVRLGICEMQIETPSGKVTVTISIGVTDLAAHLLNADDHLDLLLNRADRALYYAKHNGRNITHLLNGQDFEQE